MVKGAGGDPKMPLLTRVERAEGLLYRVTRAGQEHPHPEVSPAERHAATQGPGWLVGS